MPLKQTNAIVLGATVFKEQDKLVILLTESSGIMDAIAPGANKYKSRFGSLFELFTEGDFLYYEKENQSLVTISKGDLIKSNFFTVSDSKGFFYFYFIAEVIRKFLPKKSNSQRVYNLLKSILESSDKTVPLDSLLLYFLIWILRIEGVLFRTGICSNCLKKKISNAYVRNDFRGLLCDKCRSDEKIILSLEDLDFIDWTRNNSSNRLNELQSSFEVKKLLRLFTKMIEYNGEFLLKTKNYFPAVF